MLLPIADVLQGGKGEPPRVSDPERPLSSTMNLKIATSTPPIRRPLPHQRTTPPRFSSFGLVVGLPQIPRTFFTAQRFLQQRQ